MKKRVVLIIGIIVLCLLVGRGYASSNGSNAQVYYANVRAVGDVIINTADGTDIDFQGSLDKPGDFYEIYLDVVNGSNNDVEVANFYCNEDDDHFEYNFTYLDGSEIKLGDVLKKGESETLKYRVYYKDYLINSDISFDSSFTVDYEGVY